MTTKMNASQLFEYELHAFPRLKLLQARLSEFMEIRTTHSPLIRFECHDMYATKQLINTSRFSVKGVPGRCLNHCNSELIVTVCILQPEKSGKLTTKDTKNPSKEEYIAGSYVFSIKYLSKILTSFLLKDKELLERLIRRKPEIDVNTVVYVIDTTQCTLSTLNYCSRQISETVEPFSLVNTVCKRLFQIESSEISVRISLYFEKILLDKLPIKIQNIAAIANMLNSTTFTNETSRKLSEGLLESNNCQTFLRREAFDYRWEGEQYLRLPWTIAGFKTKLKNHLCDSLGKTIAIDLVKHLNDHLRASNVDIANEFHRMVDLSNLQTKNLLLIFTAILSSVLAMLLGSIPALVAIVVGLLFSVDVANRYFRYEIADKVHECIMAKKEELLRHVLERFCGLFLENMNKMCKVLKEFERRNNISISFHEYKTITERNSAVKACGLFGNTIKIYIDKIETSELIRKYLLQFNADTSYLEICVFREIVIAKHSFKSGNKIQLCLNTDEHYGTASFPMKDRLSQYYCATCKHVAVSSQFKIETDDGKTLHASEYYASKDLDFSLLKLKNLQKNKIFCKHGIRTEEDCFVSGEILDKDILPNDDHAVYKWGATTDLTEGNYKGIICTKKIENGNYDIETFIIEGKRENFS